MIFSISEDSDINGLVRVLSENGYKVTFSKPYKKRYEISVELETCEEEREGGQ